MTNVAPNSISTPNPVADRLARGRAAAALKRSLAETQSDENLAEEACSDLNRRPSATLKKNTPMRAIRAHCLDCTCGSYQEVQLCTAPECPLYPFRFGKRPATMAKRQAAKTEAPS